MNESAAKNQCRPRWKSLAGLFAAGLVGLTACHTTPPTSGDPKEFSGFLVDYSRLRRGDKDEANYIYIDTSVDFARYSKVYIWPVELWTSGAPDSALGRLSRQNQQMLVDYFHTAMLDALKEDFQVVSYAGPDVLVIHAAVTDAQKGRPVPGLVSHVVSPNTSRGFSQQFITGTGAGAGMVMVEAEFLDGQTGQRVAAVVDSRVGTKAVRTKFNSTWGDVKLAFDWWAQRLAARMKLIKQGNFSANPL